MKIPKKINVKGQNYKIKFVKNLKNEEGEECDGLCDRKKRLIEIDSALKGGDLKSTFIHECLHAVVIECSLHEVISYGAEEIIVGNMESFLMKHWRLYLK